MGPTVRHRYSSRSTATGLPRRLRCLKDGLEEPPAGSVGAVVEVQRPPLDQGHGEYRGDRFPRDVLDHDLRCRDGAEDGCRLPGRLSNFSSVADGRR